MAINSINWEVWFTDTVNPEKKRRLAAFHFRFHAERFVESVSSHPGNYEIVKVTLD